MEVIPDEGEPSGGGDTSDVSSRMSRSGTEGARLSESVDGSRRSRTLEGGEQRLHAAEGRDGIGPACQRQDPAPPGADPTRSEVEPMEPEILELIGVPFHPQQQELEGLRQVVGDARD